VLVWIGAHAAPQQLDPFAGTQATHECDSGSVHLASKMNADAFHI
jgi:hypothetical protein